MTCRSEEPDAKKAKGDEDEEEYNLADITEGSVTSVRIRGDITNRNCPFQINYFRLSEQANVDTSISCHP